MGLLLAAAALAALASGAKANEGPKVRSRCELCRSFHKLCTRNHSPLLPDNSVHYTDMCQLQYASEIDARCCVLRGSAPMQKRDSYRDRPASQLTEHRG